MKICIVSYPKTKSRLYKIKHIYIAEKDTTLLWNIRDVLGIKVFVAALGFVPFLFLINLQS